MFDPSFSFRFPPADERRFVAWYDECYAPQRPLTIRLGTAAYAAIGGFDVAFAVRDLPKVLIVRAIVTVALIAAYWLHVRGHLLATQNSLAIATTIAGLGLIVIDRLAYVDRDHSYLPTGLMQVMLFGAMGRLRVSFLGPIAGILAIAAAGSVATAFHTGPGLFERLLVLDTGIAISLLTGYLLERQSRAEYLLKGYVSTLAGLLPICAHCKRIREGDGDGSSPAEWTAIEAYVSRRTAATFTHSLCAQCQFGLYGYTSDGP